MRFYRVQDDWLRQMEGDFRTETLGILKSLDLQRLQKYPPPKVTGLPIGNEFRVLSSYIGGKAAQFDASALSRFYRSFASDRDRLHYKAFRATEKLSRKEWASIIGAQNVDIWAEKNFLRFTGDEKFVCQFSVVGFDGLIFMVDPMNDHGNPVEHLVLDGDYTEKDVGSEIQPFYHIYIGQDSLMLIANMKQHGLPTGGRYLDCGPGAGALLLYFSRQFEEAVGVDLNPRAAGAVDINAELNDLTNVKSYQGDAYNLGDKYGKFDLLSWNTPFLFLPEDVENEAMEAFGGDFGIASCLRFIDTVPDLMTESGLACVLTMAPRLMSGENVLEQQLKAKLQRQKLDCTIRVAQAAFAHNREVWHFHQKAGIRKFEAVYLYLTRGSGKIKRIEPTAVRMAVDVLREKMYRRKFA